MNLLFLFTPLRAAIATTKVLFEAEYGGTLYDFTAHRNGDLERICKWENDAEMVDAHAILENATESGRDFVYVGAVKTGERRGYMFVHSSKRGMWMRGFIPGLYEPLEAFQDALKLAGKDAKELGFRIEDVTLGGSSGKVGTEN